MGLDVHLVAPDPGELHSLGHGVAHHLQDLDMGGQPIKVQAGGAFSLTDTGEIYGHVIKDDVRIGVVKWDPSGVPVLERPRKLGDTDLGASIVVYHDDAKGKVANGNSWYFREDYSSVGEWLTGVSVASSSAKDKSLLVGNFTYSFLEIRSLAANSPNGTQPTVTRHASPSHPILKAGLPGLVGFTRSAHAFLRIVHTSSENSWLLHHAGGRVRQYVPAPYWSDPALCEAPPAAKDLTSFPIGQPFITWRDGEDHVTEVNGKRTDAPIVVKDMNSQGIGLHGDYGGYIWRNGQEIPMDELTGQSPSVPGASPAWQKFSLNCINEKGLIAGTAVRIKDSAGHPIARPQQKAEPVILLPVEIVNASKAAVTKLKVGKMSDTGVLTGAEATATLDVDKDPDRFFIRVPGGASMGGISVKVSTTDNPDSVYNDIATQIDLQADGGDAISKSMLLVSDDVDDGYAVDGIADNATGDRTHKIQLGGNFKIEEIKVGTENWQTLGAKVSAPVEKTVTFGVVIMRQTAGGSPVVAQADVESDLKIAQERYAQTGVKLSWSISTADPPAGVDLSDGLKVVAGDPATWKQVAAEARSLIHSLGTDSTNSDIHVFYVNFVDAFGSLGSWGVAVADFWFDASEDSYLYNCFVSASRGPFTTPHELAHLLADEGHHVNSFNLFNLLRNGTSTSNVLGGSKRLDSSQSQKIQANPRSK